MTVWDTGAALQRLRPLLSRYLTDNARVTDVSSIVEGLWQLETGDFQQLIATHVALSQATTALLEVAGPLLRELPSTQHRSSEEFRGFVRGPVDWQRTKERRVRTGDRTVFVCRPTERRYDTPLARLLTQALHICAGLPDMTGLSEEGTLGARIHETGRTAEGFLLHSKLSRVRHTALVRAEVVEALARRRESARILSDFITLANLALDEHDPVQIAAVVAEQLLAPGSSATVFELLVGFDLVQALNSAGFVSQPSTRLLSGGSLPFARLRRADGVALRVWWQRPLWSLDWAPKVEGLMKRTYVAAGMQSSQLKPDFLIEFVGQQRAVVVEAKLTEGDGVAAERRGAQEAIAYLADADDMFDADVEPQALVVAWNATGRPARSRVMITDQDHISEAISELLST